MGLNSCAPVSEYDRMLEQELAKGIRKDSLLLGITFGMSSEALFKYCAQLEQEGIVKLGTARSNIYYEVPESQPVIEANFLPVFFNDRLYQIPIQFNYRDWSPWNKQLIIDSLSAQLLRRFQVNFGSPFILIDNHPGPTYARLEGNRQIVLTVKDDLMVEVVFTDLLAKQQIDGLE